MSKTCNFFEEVDRTLNVLCLSITTGNKILQTWTERGLHFFYVNMKQIYVVGDVGNGRMFIEAYN